MAEFGVPTAGQLEKINTLAKRTLSKDEVFSFHTKMVGDALLTERLVQLSKPLLDVFKADAKTGIAFMLDHPWAGFMRPKPAYPYGRTYDAVLKKADGSLEGENWALFGDTYIVRGKEKDGVSTDAIIADIEDGTLFDVSVGFGFSTSICSVCGNEYYSSNCEHWRGGVYDGQLCYIIGKPPGWLGELSGVWDGAYPTAGVLSKDGSSDAQKPFILLDDMPKEDLKRVPSNITTYGFYSAVRGDVTTYFKKDDLAKGNVFTVPDLSNLKGGGKQVENEVKTYTQEEVDALVKEAADKAVADAMEKLSADVQASAAPLVVYMTQQDVVEKLGKELPADKVLSYAKEGESYMSQLIDDAVAMGVRAQGNDFPAETWKATFGGMGSQQIKDIMATFEKQAKEDIPAGRQTKANANQESFVQTELPDEAYKA